MFSFFVSPYLEEVYLSQSLARSHLWWSELLLLSPFQAAAGKASLYNTTKTSPLWFPTWKTSAANVLRGSPGYFTAWSFFFIKNIIYWPIGSLNFRKRSLFFNDSCPLKTLMFDIIGVFPCVLMQSSCSPRHLSPFPPPFEVWPDTQNVKKRGSDQKFEHCNQEKN